MLKYCARCDKEMNVPPYVKFCSCGVKLFRLNEYETADVLKIQKEELRKIQKTINEEK